MFRATFFYTTAKAVANTQNYLGTASYLKIATTIWEARGELTKRLAAAGW